MLFSKNAIRNLIGNVILSLTQVITIKLKLIHRTELSFSKSSDVQTGVAMVLIDPLKTMTNLRKTSPTLLTVLGYKSFYYFLNKGKPTAVFINCNDC